MIDLWNDNNAPRDVIQEFVDSYSWDGIIIPDAVFFESLRDQRLSEEVYKMDFSKMTFTSSFQHSLEETFPLFINMKVLDMSPVMFPFKPPPTVDTFVMWIQRDNNNTNPFDMLLASDHLLDVRLRYNVHGEDTIHLLCEKVIQTFPNVRRFQLGSTILDHQVCKIRGDSNGDVLSVGSVTDGYHTSVTVFFNLISFFIAN